MSKSLSSNLKSHIEGDLTNLATCWKITRTDNTVMGFTDYENDIVFESVTYIAASGFFPTDVMSRDDMSVDNMEVTGILDSSYITEADLQAGIYDFAEIEIFMVNYSDLTQGRLWLKRGWIGQVRVSRGQFEAEIRGLAQKLSQNIGRIVSPVCDATLGDTRCGVNLASFTSGTITVTSVTDNQFFVTDEVITDNSYYKGGKLTWVTGNNAGLSMEVKEFNQDSEITLILPMSETIQVGDTLNVIAGCNKYASTCKDKFSNYLNFRGFPDLPGQDKLFETSGTFTKSDT